MKAEPASQTWGTELNRFTSTERGAATIEYIVLGAAIIALIYVLATDNDVENALQDFLNTVFN